MPRQGVQNNGSLRVNTCEVSDYSKVKQNQEETVVRTTRQDPQREIRISFVEEIPVIQNGGHVEDLCEDEGDPLDVKNQEFADILASFEAQLTEGNNDWLRTKLEGEMNLDIGLFHDSDPVSEVFNSDMISALNLMSNSKSNTPIDPSTWLNYDEQFDFLKSPSKEIPPKFPNTENAIPDPGGVSMPMGTTADQVGMFCTTPLPIVPNLQPDKVIDSITLMTREELERMPVGGLEFDESVGVTEDDPGHSAVSAVHNMTLPLNVSSVEISMLKKKGITQIILETETGQQQVYMVNTSELVDASKKHKPVALEVVSSKIQPGTSTVQNNTNTNRSHEGANPNHGPTIDVRGKENSAKIDGIAESHGSITIVNPTTGVRTIQSILLNAHTAAGRIKGTGTAAGILNLGHIQRAAKPKHPVIECSEPGCTKMFDKQSKYKLHMMKHRNERPYKCDFEDCEWAFTTAHRLKRHRDVHDKVKNFTCPAPGCEKAFSTPYNLNTHILIHDRPRVYCCDMTGCQDSFTRSKELDKHIANCHPNEGKQYECSHEGCMKSFLTPSGLRTHMRVHKAPSVLDTTCQYCGKQYQKLCRLRQHIRLHTGERPFVCTHQGCTAAFSSASKLTRHHLKHSQIRRYRCDCCGKTFMRADHLKGHVVIHTGLKPFACTQQGCASRFSSKSSLMSHLRKHASNKVRRPLFNCPIESCEKSFEKKIDLRTHLVYHYQTTEQPQSLPLSDENSDDTNTAMSSTIMECLESFELADGTVAMHTIPAPEALIGSQGDGSHGDIGTADILNRGNSLVEFINTETFPTNIITEKVGHKVVTQLIATDITNAFPEIAQSVQRPPSSMVISAPHLPPDDPSTPALSFSSTSKPAPPPQPQPGKSLLKKSKIAFSKEWKTNQDLHLDSCGAARTDFYKNEELSNWAKRRRVLLKETAASKPNKDNYRDVTRPVPIAPSTGTMSAATLPSASEMLTSQAITFRDPETGNTYIQTQLLQDDPPNTNLFTEDTQSSSLSLGNELLADRESQSQTHHSLTQCHNHTTAHFTGTTINLQDLESTSL